MSPALREDDVLEEPLPVQHDVPDLVVMRHQLEFREPQAAQPARVGRIDALAGQLRMGENALRAIHRACAATHHQSVETAQELLQADFVQETVLRGDVAAAEDDPVRAADKLRGPAGVAPVQHRDGGGGDPGIADAVRHRREHVVGEFRVVRGGADQQEMGPRGQFRLHRGKKTVVGGEMVLPEAGRTACQDQCHRGSKDSEFCFSLSFLRRILSNIHKAFNGGLRWLRKAKDLL